MSVKPKRAARSIKRSRKGFAPTGRSGLGVSRVNAPRRVPRPPTRITHCEIIAAPEVSFPGDELFDRPRQPGACQVSQPSAVNLTGLARVPLVLSASTKFRRFSGVVMNIMKPPPPAPETLPPMAPLRLARL